MVPEAKLVKKPGGLRPSGEGWFVLNAREAQWFEHPTFGRFTRFEGDPRFSEYGINISLLEPGKVSCMYHRENAQEDFLVLFGECLLLVEGEERRLRQWDFVHCPAWTEHVFVGAGTGPCGILMVGARPEVEQLRYPVVEVALEHGAGVQQETASGTEAYAPFPAPAEGPYREGTLPDTGG
jgi:uncharacterized cupin superfamily protein